MYLQEFICGIFYNNIRDCGGDCRGHCLGQKMKKIISLYIVAIILKLILSMFIVATMQAEKKVEVPEEVRTISEEPEKQYMKCRYQCTVKCKEIVNRIEQLADEDEKDIPMYRYIKLLKGKIFA